MHKGKETVKESFPSFMQKEDYVTTSDGQDALISREGLAVSRSQWALTAASVVYWEPSECRPVFRTPGKLQ